jgi:hypothetical protein
VVGYGGTCLYSQLLGRWRWGRSQRSARA